MLKGRVKNFNKLSWNDKKLKGNNTEQYDWKKKQGTYLKIIELNDQGLKIAHDTNWK